MADQFQIPQRTPPQGSPPAPPYDLVQSYINRPFQYAGMVGDATKELYNAYVQQQQNKVAAIKALGPAMANQIYGTNVQSPPPPQTGDSNQNPPMAPAASGMMGQGQIAGQAGVGTTNPTNSMTAPQSSAQTLQTPQAPGGPQDTQPSQVILDHANATGFDPTGHAAQFGQSTQPTQIGNPNQGIHAKNIQDLQRMMAYNSQMGDRGLELNKSLQDQLAAEKALMEGEQFNATKQQTQQNFETGQAAEESRFERGQGLKAGQSSADQQTKYNVQDQKIQAGFAALKDYYTALQKVPATQKGAGVGILTSKAGSAAGGMAPALVAANKARDLAVSTLATALLPEQARSNPEAIREISRGLPSVGDAPQVVSAGFGDLYNKLQTVHQLNVSGNQAAAQAFGGKITPSQVPKMNFGGQQGQSNMVTIRDSQGGMHRLPAQNLQAAKKRDPGLQVVNQ